MKKNGKTKAGTQRWRCSSCGASFTRKIDNKAKLLDAFLSWLFSKASIAELGISRPTFWRRFSWIWKIWPVAPYTGEVFNTVFLDGIWFGHKAVILIAYAEGHVISWHLARSECSEAWVALMMKIPAPLMLVSDGASGLAKAASIIWPSTRIQRCTFHASCQVKRCTTLKPKLEAGRELLEIANKLNDVKDPESAAHWIVKYSTWCTRWEGFLGEYTFKDGKKQYVHRELRKARRSLNKLIHSGQLFTFIEMGMEYGGIWPSTNNAIESVNARLREMLLLHRGMPFMHRIKAVFWWCYMHTEYPLSPSEILHIMPTDDDVEGLYTSISRSNGKDEGVPEEYGSGIVWEEFHMPTKYRQ